MINEPVMQRLIIVKNSGMAGKMQRNPPHFPTTMLVKRNATLIHEFFVSSVEEVDQL